MAWMCQHLGGFTLFHHFPRTHHHQAVRHGRDHIEVVADKEISQVAILLQPNQQRKHLPFRISGAILALTSLDFLGLGVPPSVPSLGELLAQGKANLDAWWISAATFAVLVCTLLLLTFMGDALRRSLDTRRADWVRASGQV
jgi:ABC-type antimicrobial peptide transport system permease subunit